MPPRSNGDCRRGGAQKSRLRLRRSDKDRVFNVINLSKSDIQAA
jgi:hypothetical protein